MLPRKRVNRIGVEQRSYLRPLIIIVAVLAIGLLVKLNSVWLANALSAAFLFVSSW